MLLQVIHDRFKSSSFVFFLFFPKHKTRRLGKQNARICCYHNPLWVRPVWPYTPSTGIVNHNDVLPADKECRSRKLHNKYHFAPGQHFSSVLCLSTWGFSQKNVKRIILGKVQMQEFHVIRWHQCSVSLDSGITTWSQFNKNHTRVLAGIFSKLNQTPSNELDDTLISQKTRLTSAVRSTTPRCEHVSLQLFTHFQIQEIQSDSRWGSTDPL